MNKSHANGVALQGDTVTQVRGKPRVVPALRRVLEVEMRGIVESGRGGGFAGAVIRAVHPVGQDLPVVLPVFSNAESGLRAFVESLDVVRG